MAARSIIGFNRPAMALNSGDHVGDFELLEALSEGAVISTWRAQRAGDDRVVQLKVIREDRVPEPARRRAFEQLVSALTKVGRLEHAGLQGVVATAIRNQDAVFGLACELLPGASLAEAQPAEHANDLPRLYALVEQLIEVLAWLHDHGIAHGHITPANVWVVPRPKGPQAKLLDLCWSQAGLCRRTSDSKRYAAPEQSGDEVATSASDQWAVSIILQDLLRGHDKEVDDVLSRGSSQFPGDRYANMRAFAAALREAMPAGSSSQASPTPTVELSPITGTESPTEDLGAVSVPTQEVEAVESPTDRMEPVRRPPPPQSLASIDPSADARLPAAPVPRPQDPTDVFRPVRRSNKSKTVLIALAVIALGGLAAVAAVQWWSTRTPAKAKVDTAAAPVPPIKPAPPAVAEPQKAPPPNAAPPAKTDAEAQAKTDAKAKQDALRAKCKSGRASSCIALAKLLPRESAGLHWRACRLGTRSSCWTAGRKYESRRPALARRAYEKGCDSGRGQACARLAYLMRRGLGGDPNPRTAEAFEARACRLGHRASCP